MLYGLSNFAFFVMYRLLGYRKKVVFNNLKNSFPDKNDKELTTIMEKFYRHFCDVIVEVLKGFTISEKQLDKRFKIRNRELVDRLFKENKNIVFVGGHYNNWEMLALGVAKQMDHYLIGIYKPLHDQFFDKKMQESRAKYGMNLCPMRQTKKFFEQDFGKPKGIIFGMDQSPSNPKSAYWMNFLNQDSGFQFGAEKYAKDFNYPVVYGVIHKVKRGHYEAEFKLISETPNELPYGGIIEKSAHLLEQDILNAPQYWLWTHRRWKHKRPTE